MTEIAVTSDWFRSFNTELFIKWTEEMNIAETDWDFTSNYVFVNPKFVFVNEVDAIAFKLKFL